MNTLKHLAKIGVLTACSLFVVLPAQAEYRSGHHLRGQFERQEERIRRGVESGAITPREARHLEREQREIRALARDFRDDGHLSYREREILERRLDNLDRRISQLKHNDNDRGYRPRYHDDWRR